MNKQTFVAREGELATLAAALSAAEAGQAQFRFITGEAGGGKTTLVEAFVNRAQETDPDLIGAWGTCDAQTGASDPHLPFRQILQLLVGDVADTGATSAENRRRLGGFLRVSTEVVMEIGPELIGLFIPGAGLVAKAGAFAVQKTGWLDRLEFLAGRNPPTPGEVDPSRIFEQYTGVLKAMAAEQPLVLVLEDLQWADMASLNLLFYLGRNLKDSPILLLGTYRPAEVALGRDGDRHPLLKVMAEFKRYFGQIEITLDEKPATEEARFVSLLVDLQANHLNGEFRQRLAQHTGGNPLFTLELIRHMQEEVFLEQEQDGCWIVARPIDWSSMPARVEGVIEERLARLDEQLCDLLGVASVEGEEFTAQVLARIEHLPERQLLRQLRQETEKRHRLVVGRGEEQLPSFTLSHFRFSHALFQQYLYHQLGPGERRLLHGDVAAILEELYGDDLTQVVVRLAHHYVAAGNRQKAIAYLQQAGDLARSLFAYQDAARYYRQALDFLLETGANERAARTWMKLGLTYHLDFDFAKARDAYQHGFALWQDVTEKPSSRPPAPHPLRVDWAYQPLSLDPALAADTESGAVIEQLFSGLVSLTPSMNVVPDLAQSWELLEDGSAYRFTLASDLKWSDGQPLTAHDFVYAWRRVLDPATESPLAGLLSDVDGAATVQIGETSPNELGVFAPDDHTLVIRLARPAGYFLQLLAYHPTFPVPRHVVQAYGAEWSEPDKIVTCGPFRLVSWQPESCLTLARNAACHRPVTGNVERIELRTVDGWKERLTAYEQGELDTLYLWSLADGGAQARQRHPEEYLSLPWLGTTYVGFQAAEPPLDDPLVRRALVLAVDRAHFADIVLLGAAFPATGGLVPPGMPGHAADIALPFDPAAARLLLVQAGHPDGQGLPALSLLSDEGSEKPCRFLAQQWQQHLGLEVDWQTVPWEAFVARMEESPPHVFVGAWAADYPDPDNFLRVAEAVRWSRWQHQVYPRLIADARRLTDTAERLQLYYRAQRILNSEAAVMPLIYWRSHLMVKPWVKQLPTSALKWWYWKDVVIEPH